MLESGVDGQHDETIPGACLRLPGPAALPDLDDALGRVVSLGCRDSRRYPPADESFLGLLSALFASWKRRKEPAKAETS